MVHHFIRKWWTSFTSELYQGCSTQPSSNRSAQITKTYKQKWSIGTIHNLHFIVSSMKKNLQDSPISFVPLLFILISAFQLISISLPLHYILQNGSIHTDLFAGYSSNFLSSEHPGLSLYCIFLYGWQRECGFSPFWQNKVIS